MCEQVACFVKAVGTYKRESHLFLSNIKFAANLGSLSDDTIFSIFG